MTDRERLLQTLAAIYAYYERELSDFAVRMWLEDLAGYPIEAVCEAFARHRRDTKRGQWLPKSADILAQLQGDADEQALIAWGEVISAARSGGGRFDGPTQEAIDAMGGMGRIRMATEQENGFLQRQFVASYKAYRTRKDAPPLIADESLKRFGLWIAGTTAEKQASWEKLKELQCPESK